MESPSKKAKAPSHPPAMLSPRPTTSEYRQFSTPAALHRSSPKRQAQSRPNSATSPQPTRTYESFWSEHTRNAHLYSHRSPGRALAEPSLAPPADILHRSQTAQYPGQNRAAPPRLQTSNMPATPQRHTFSGTRTPAQQSADEQDAIDSLIFMSSPNNTGYFPGNSVDSTPVRNAVGPSPQKGFLTTGHSRHEVAADVGRSVQAKLPLQDLDKRLDEIEDESSDDEYGGGSTTERMR